MDLDQITPPGNHGQVQSQRYGLDTPYSSNHTAPSGNRTGPRALSPVYTINNEACMLGRRGTECTLPPRPNTFTITINGGRISLMHGRAARFAPLGDLARRGLCRPMHMHFVYVHPCSFGQEIIDQ